MSALETSEPSMRRSALVCFRDEGSGLSGDKGSGLRVQGSEVIGAQGFEYRVER